MTGEPFHLDPEKEWSASGANFSECFGCGIVNLLHVLAIDPSPVVRLENIQRERIGLSRRHADPIGVVFDEKEQRQLLFLGKTDRFEKIPLARRGIAYRGHDEILLAVELNAPRNSTRR